MNSEIELSSLQEACPCSPDIKSLLFGLENPVSEPLAHKQSLRLLGLRLNGLETQVPQQSIRLLLKSPRLISKKLGYFLLADREEAPPLWALDSLLSDLESPCDLTKTIAISALCKLQSRRLPSSIPDNQPEYFRKSLEAALKSTRKLFQNSSVFVRKKLVMFLTSLIRTQPSVVDPRDIDWIVKGFQAGGPVVLAASAPLFLAENRLFSNVLPGSTNAESDSSQTPQKSEDGFIRKGDRFAEGNDESFSAFFHKENEGVQPGKWALRGLCRIRAKGLNSDFVWEGEGMPWTQLYLIRVVTNEFYKGKLPIEDIEGILPVELGKHKAPPTAQPPNPSLPQSNDTDTHDSDPSTARPLHLSVLLAMTPLCLEVDPYKFMDLLFKSIESYPDISPSDRDLLKAISLAKAIQRLNINDTFLSLLRQYETHEDETIREIASKALDSVQL